MTSAVRSLLLVIGLASLSLPARADVLRFEYGGVITQAGASSGVTPGSRFSGTIAYDPDKPGGRLTIEGQSQYYFGAPNWNTVSSAESSLSVENRVVYSNLEKLTIVLWQSDYAGQFGYHDGAGNPYGPRSAIEIHSSATSWATDGLVLSLANPSAAVLPSSAWDLALPRSIELSKFPKATMTFQPTGGEPALSFSGTIDTFHQVPEPGAIVLVGLLGLLRIERDGETDRKSCSRTK